MTGFGRDDLFNAIKSHARGAAHTLGVALSFVGLRYERRCRKIRFHGGGRKLEMADRIVVAPEGKAAKAGDSVAGVAIGLKTYRVLAANQPLLESSRAAMHGAHCSMRVGQIGIEPQRRSRSAFAVVAGFPAPEHVPLRQRHRCPCLRVIRIDLDHAIANADDDFVAPLVVTKVELPRHQVELVRFRIGRAALLEGLFFLRQQRQFKRGDYRLGDFILQRENVI